MENQWTELTCRVAVGDLDEMAAIAQMVDAGRVEYLEMPWFDEAVKAVEAL